VKIPSFTALANACIPLLLAAFDASPTAKTIRVE